MIRLLTSACQLQGNNNIRRYISTYDVQEQQNIRKTSFLKMANVFSVFRDLKRDVAKKLEKLEKRTQRAIVELISKL